MNDYNFFEIYERKKGFEFNLRSPFVQGGIIVALVLILTLFAVGRNIFLTVKINTLNNQSYEVKQTEEYIEANQLQNSLDAMATYDASAALVLKAYDEANYLNTNLINTLLSGIPANVTVVSLGIDGPEFGMTCNAPNREAAAELVLGLKNTGVCEEVTLNSVTTNADGSSAVVSINGILKTGDE